MGRRIVGMITSYQGVNQSDWLWQQTPNPFGVWKTIQILKNAPKPDVLLLYQYDFFRQSTRRKSWLDRLQPPQLETVSLSATELRGVPRERAIYLLREPPLEEILHKNKINYEAAKSYCGYVFGPDDSAPTPDYMPAIWYHANSFRELEQLPVPEKPKRCSWITSGINRTKNHRQRLAFLQQLQQIELDVDLYGRGLPSGARSNGELKNKWYGMAPYYYNLAIENYADNDWYVSEKLWDSLLAWCLPIYYGGSAADRLLPPGSFLRLPSLDEKGVAYIQEVITSPETWYQAKDAIAEARQIILHKLNLLNWLSEFVEKYF
ncbi:glycosyltransferase family 10 domain-containing protein [Thermocoleostomius sinensis]|uniref:Glycosyltransferase family 10 n=1 Tax=Thermocoleostomius sinensis A174 TaxID=2016057 RepID=A0A9E8ZC19_9CYAN|nr:glycosyltransferase family 10 [Thermocoleostomius sinensis]WAL59082.1 glycosyltransferase family 10 [Thermocoleostomius sinensis A174]